LKDGLYISSILFDEYATRLLIKLKKTVRVE
jgi:hypothetical protein